MQFGIFICKASIVVWYIYSRAGLCSLVKPVMLFGIFIGKASLCSSEYLQAKLVMQLGIFIGKTSLHSVVYLQDNPVHVVCCIYRQSQYSFQKPPLKVKVFPNFQTPKFPQRVGWILPCISVDSPPQSLCKISG